MRPNNSDRSASVYQHGIYVVIKTQRREIMESGEEDGIVIEGEEISGDEFQDNDFLLKKPLTTPIIPPPGCVFI